MKRFALALVLLYFSGAGTLRALDLSFVGGVDNFAFDPGLRSSQGTAGKSFEPDYFVVANIKAAGRFSDILGYSLEYDRGPILRNRLLASVGLDFTYLGLELGPFFGIFNNLDKPLKPGMAAAVNFRVPGIVFASLSAHSTVGTGLIVEGDYVQEYGRIAAGFWVPYAVVTLSAAREEYTELHGGGLTIQDEKTRYQFTANAYKKNVPFTVDINLGYQTLKRSYIGAQTETDELRSLFAGFEFRWNAVKPVTVLVGAEIPVYTWAEEPFEGPGDNTFLFKAYAGCIWTIPQRADF
ncbi:hypothetical protein [Breznakiella homolactica]|uniref:Uncharacterized protein n=1 Tax=Breznakiella homolactica TaxID=2798577 RepID=A0A7T8BD15_9SPIR|nr:hypothetical protein [Breznakiella homolactica]QQO10803.1 hypothetical protein JFL75_07760 [Breznakiella homolactica]